MKYILFSVSLLLLSHSNFAQKTQQEILGILNEQTECWNKGDWDCFMSAYWNSEDLMFVGSSGITYGWQKTYDNYRKNYPDKATIGKLSFEILKVSEITSEVYFVVGKWNLKRTKKEGSTGTFSLVWKKIKGEWKIVTDHSASDKI